MSTNQRGCMYLVGLLVFGFFACILFPFIVLPAVGTAVTLPVITVPAEYYRKDWPSPDFELVNSLGGALLANIIVLLIAFRARTVSRGWTQEVPGRFQGFVELIGELWWSLTREQAGTKPKVKYILFPLVASIFLFLLAGNLGKLLPGVETVGVLHCAVYEPVALNGFPVHEIEFAGMTYYALRNDAALDTGTTGTSQSYRQCNAGIGEHKYIKDGYLITALDVYLDQAVTHTTVEGDTLGSILEAYNAEAQSLASEDLPESEGRGLVADHLADGNYHQIKLTYGDPYAQYQSWREVVFTLEDVLTHNSDETGELSLSFASFEVAQADDDGDAPAELALADTPLEAGQVIVLRPELFGESATTRANQIYTVAPFIRGVATDLSFTIGLALLAFVAIQAFGFSELGIGYLQKFINVNAVGNIAKRPLGAIDFVVGLFEIISEVGKIISLSFRLFGALFAGTVLYAVIMFLTGTTIPVIILALEIIVGTAQAGVFAVLTMLFCAQAMVSHHHDDEHGEAHH